MTVPTPGDTEATVDATASDIVAAARDVGKPIDGGPVGTVLAPTGTDAAGRPWPPFAHGSETEMARILDFYGVRWEYEPRMFPILWNMDGVVVESFSPDFYLPDLDLFLELTTLKQSLVRKKNRKLRRLRELYPDIRIKLFYARDFRAMMLKYGRLGLADSMSGTLGQVVPDRGRELGLEAAAITGPDASADSGSDRGDGTSAASGPGSDSAGSSDTERPAGAGVLSVARSGSGGPTVVRRNASRSRRRRAAAAARAAARGPADTSARLSSGHRQEDPASR
ncbi:MAG: hypothetical protein EPO36_06240 [Chloroflexota bacterium]|nr:MAG: hypothetical protein EPO36_06240 [Chloroflexota bacterium]